MMIRLQSKFLIMLLAGAVFLTACEGDQGETGPKGAEGPAGKDGKDGADGSTLSFYFQEGLKGYEGTRDIGIYNRPDQFGENVPLPTPDGGYLYAISAENSDDTALTDSATTLIRFDGLAEIIEESNGKSICSGDFFVNEATLYLSGVFSNPAGSGQDYLQVGIYGDSSPDFDELSATWEKPNADENWDTPGGGETWAFNDRFFESFVGENIGYIHPLPNAPFMGPIYHKPFYIPREAVMKWLCEGNNKGLVLAPFFDEGFLMIYSSEHSDLSTRPMLYISIDKNDVNTRRKILSPEEARAQWDQKSYEEKMAPFYQLYPSLRPVAGEKSD